MSAPLTVADDRVVLFHYVLKDEAGEVLDASGEHAMVYLHGHHNIVPGLEKQLTGKAVGDELTAVVPPEEAYGTFDEEAYQKVPRKEMPKDLDLQVGMPLHFRASDGRIATLFVTDIKGAWVTVTSNHPLAGKTLTFDVAITGIREATPDELTHGHAHGPDGHHHHH